MPLDEPGRRRAGPDPDLNDLGLAPGTAVEMAPGDLRVTSLATRS